MNTHDLEDLIQTAQIVHACPLDRSGGGQEAQLLVLEGGVGVVAKLAESGNATHQLQIRAECAAWLLAQLLEWPDLVPVTTMRVVRSLRTDSYMATSVQLAWPLFEVAAEAGPGGTPRYARDCPADEISRVALFDVLALNSDRHGLNWGFVRGMDDRPKLIDHGHAFDAATSASFDFINERRGQPVVPGEYVDQVRRLLDPQYSAPLAQILPDATFQRAVTEATNIVRTGNFPS
jgi:hypothetical protein